MLAVSGSASIPAIGMFAVPQQPLQQTRAAAVANDRHFELCLVAVADSISPSLQVGEKKFDAVVVSTEWTWAGLVMSVCRLDHQDDQKHREKSGDF